MSAEYVLVTDSACDISPAMLKEWNVETVRLAYLFTDDGIEKKEHEQPLAEFYKGMRSGRVAKTSAVNEDAFETLFTEILETVEGRGGDDAEGEAV